MRQHGQYILMGSAVMNSFWYGKDAKYYNLRAGI
jgi:hypothetical protein